MFSWYLWKQFVETRYLLTSITRPYHRLMFSSELIKVEGFFSVLDRYPNTGLWLDRILKPSQAALLGFDKSMYYRLIHCHWQVLCWGVRNMKKFQLTSVTSPSIEFECAGEVRQSDVIKDTKKNPNFDKPVLARMIVVTMPVFILCGKWSVTMRPLTLRNPRGSFTGFHPKFKIGTEFAIPLLLSVCACYFIFQTFWL